MNEGVPGPAASGDASLMDRIYRHQRHIYDFSRKYYLLGRDDLITRLEPPPGGAVLELGCGTGRNLIAAARRYPQARFFGLDLSAAMLETAQSSIDRAGLARQITVAPGDATAFDTEALFGLAAFDRVFFSYSLSMIPDWRAALTAGWHVVAEDGRLSLVDFGAQERLPGFFKRLLLRWLAAFHVTPRTDLPAFLHTFASAHHATADVRSPYRGYAVAADVEPMTSARQSA